MNMKAHILAALREQFDRLEALLAGLDQAQISAPLAPQDWRIQDVMAHLWAWQQRSIARVEAAVLDREPVFPSWPVPNPDAEGSPDSTNDWIYTTHRGQPWPQIYQRWSDGYRRFLELAGQISERDLLDGDRYAWLGGAPLALILLASYDHHQEHFEKLETRRHMR